ncbi:hypothetical protein TNCV_3733411 [Trichonephila clavipes]|nr:hypothetical protein TNCV_3733411 [Trichonephila clavipes]
MKLKYVKHQTKFQKLSDCSTVSSDEFVAVDDDNVWDSLNHGRQRHFGLCSKLKNIFDAVFDQENETNIAYPNAYQ